MTDSPSHDAADPEILALLDFEPVPRRPSQVAGWTAQLQREFISRLAVTGSVTSACARMGKDRSGATKLYNHAAGGGFRAAWDGAVALAKRRKAEALPTGPAVTGPPPTIDRRQKWRVPEAAPADMDRDAMMRMAEEAGERITKRLLGCRRLYLQAISDSPGKRAAFEILTELPIDWKKAKMLQPQDDEPTNRANQRQPDMIVTAENGWSFGEIGYGPDKKAELRQAVDEHRAAEGLEPVDWEAD